MKTKAVIFDKDGTVLDFDVFWMPVAINATQQVLNALGVKDVQCERILAAIGVNNGVTSIKGSLCFGTYRDIAEDTCRVLDDHGYTCDIEDVVALTVDAYHNCISAGVIKPTCDNVVDVMEWLKSRGIVIVLVTSDDLTITKECLVGLGIDKYFDIVFTDDGTYPNKPDPYIIDMLCKEYDLDKSEIVMVGDTLIDMNFAKNGGIRSVGLSKTKENKEILLEKTDTVIPDISYLWEVLQ